MLMAYVVCSAVGIAGLVMIYRGKVALAKNALQDGVGLMVVGAMTVLLGVALIPLARFHQLVDRVAVLEAQLAKQQPAAENATEQK